MSWVLVFAEVTNPSLPGPDPFDQWLNRGTAGAMMCLLVWVISRGIPNIIDSFREDSKEQRVSHEKVVQTVSEQHARVVEAVTKDAAQQRDQFKAALDRTIDKFTDRLFNERTKSGQ